MSRHNERLLFTSSKATAPDGHAAATIATAHVDRQFDKLDIDGMDISGFERTGGPVLYGHDYNSIPVGKATKLAKTKTALRAEWKWLTGDAFADRVRNAWDQGVLSSTSVGFRALESEPLKNGGLHFTRSELLEFSVVPVPANSRATKTLKEMGLWTIPNRDDVFEVADCTDIAELAEALTRSLRNRANFEATVRAEVTRQFRHIQTDLVEQAIREGIASAYGR